MLTNDFADQPGMSCPFLYTYLYRFNERLGKRGSGAFFSLEFIGWSGKLVCLNQQFSMQKKDALPMDRRTFLRKVSLTAFGGTLGPFCTRAVARSAASARQKQKPNVIVIMVDDMGYAGVSCFGNPYFKTP